MRSSLSTPSRSVEWAVPLFVWMTGEDHPKACTGRRLLQRGLAKPWNGHGAEGRAPIVLDPRAPEPFSPLDAPRARSSGLLVVDCSWNRLSDRGGFDKSLSGLSRFPRRRLPWLLAGNPQHYGRLGELNTAEALASALEILGERDMALRLLDVFAGGPGFLALNTHLLAAYRSARTVDELRAIERDFF